MPRRLGATISSLPPPASTRQISFSIGPAGSLVSSRMHQQHPVDRIIGEGQLALIGEGDEVAPVGRPAEHPLRGRHQRHRALGLGRHADRNGVA